MINVISPQDISQQEEQQKKRKMRKSILALQNISFGGGLKSFFINVTNFFSLFSQERPFLLKKTKDEDNKSRSMQDVLMLQGHDHVTV